MRRTLFLSEMKPAPKSTGNKWQAEYIFYTYKWYQDTVYFDNPDTIKKSWKKEGYLIK